MYTSSNVIDPARWIIKSSKIKSKDCVKNIQMRAYLSINQVPEELFEQNYNIRKPVVDIVYKVTFHHRVFDRVSMNFRF